MADLEIAACSGCGGDVVLIEPGDISTFTIVLAKDAAGEIVTVGTPIAWCPTCIEMWNEAFR